MGGIVFFFGSAGRAARCVMIALAIPACLVVGYFTLKEYVAWTWIVGASSAAIFVRWGGAFRLPTLALLGALATLGFMVRTHVISLPSEPVNMYDLQLMACMAVMTLCLIATVRDAYLPPFAAALAAKMAFISYSLHLFHEPLRVLAASRFGFTGDDGGLYMSASGACITIAASLAVCALITAALVGKHVVLRRWIKARFQVGRSVTSPVRTYSARSAS